MIPGVNLRKGVNQVQSLGLVILCAILSVCGNLTLKRAVGLVNLADGSSLLSLSALVRLIQVPTLYAGLALYALGALLWLQVLSVDPIGRAYPVLVSFTFVLIVVASRILFRESITLLQVSGLFLILLGIAMVARG